MVQSGVEDIADEIRNIFDGGWHVGGVVLGWRCLVSLVGSKHAPLDFSGQLP